MNGAGLLSRVLCFPCAVGNQVKTFANEKPSQLIESRNGPDFVCQTGQTGHECRTHCRDVNNDVEPCEPARISMRGLSKKCKLSPTTGGYQFPYRIYACTLEPHGGIIGIQDEDTTTGLSAGLGATIVNKRVINPGYGYSKTISNLIETNMVVLELHHKNDFFLLSGNIDLVNITALTNLYPDVFEREIFEPDREDSAFGFINVNVFLYISILTLLIFQVGTVFYKARLIKRLRERKHELFAKAA